MYQQYITAFTGIQIQALPFVCAAFLNHLQPVPQEGGAVAWLAVTVQPVFFNPPAEGIVDVAVVFNGQAMFDIVIVTLGTAGYLFAAGTSVSIVLILYLNNYNFLPEYSIFNLHLLVLLHLEKLLF